MRTWVRRAERGYSFIELLIVTTILLILAAGIRPLARVTIQRQKASELPHNLRAIRQALDYKSTGRAVALSLLGWAITFGVGAVVGLLMARPVS